MIPLLHASLHQFICLIHFFYPSALLAIPSTSNDCNMGGVVVRIGTEVGSEVGENLLSGGL